MYSLDVIAASLHIINYLFELFLKKERLDPASGTRRRNNNPLLMKLENDMFNYNKAEALLVNVHGRRKFSLLSRASKS
jgi:hypothetical protein